MRKLMCLVSLLLAAPVHAQDVPADERFEQLEQDVMLLKRQQERLRVSGRGESSPPDSGGDVGSAQTNVRIMALEDEIKNLRGQLEEKNFESRRISEEMERFKKDTEYRLSEIERAMQPAAPAAQPPAAAATPSQVVPEKVEKKALTKTELSVKDAPGAVAEAPPAAPPAGETPRDHYNYAFRLLNQNQYEDAAKSFGDFVKRFPKDPLVGNAYYWQGETHYIRKDFSKAADNFRQGFETMPSGPKAGDNLLKLGMSLGALKKDKEACVVLSQVVAKFKAASPNVASKAQAEHKRLGCA